MQNIIFLLHSLVSLESGWGYKLQTDWSRPREDWNFWALVKRQIICWKRCHLSERLTELERDAFWQVVLLLMSEAHSSLSIVRTFALLLCACLVLKSPLETSRVPRQRMSNSCIPTEDLSLEHRNLLGSLDFIYFICPINQTTMQVSLNGDERKVSQYSGSS